MAFSFGAPASVRECRAWGWAAPSGADRSVMKHGGWGWRAAVSRGNASVCLVTLVTVQGPSFGVASSPAFGSLGGAGFGSSSAPTLGTAGSSPSLFGAASTPGGFSFTAPSSGGAFGAPASGASPFGAASMPSLFGAAASTPSLFSAAPASTPSLFGGGAGGPSPFGAAAPSSTPSLFGAGATGSLFGAPQQPAAPAGGGGQVMALLPGTAPDLSAVMELEALRVAFVPGPSGAGGIAPPGTGAPPRFQTFFLNVVPDAAARVKPAGVDDLAWRAALRRAGGADNPDNLWPVPATGFGDLLLR